MYVPSISPPSHSLTVYDAQVHIPLDPATKAPKGMAYATFLQSSAALAAFEELDQRSFQGRLLHIIPAIARTQGEPWEGKDRDGGVKGARDLLRKKEAGSGLSWGTLFMNVSLHSLVRVVVC
jgi:multiple RNA-binding domain-containing protein 1